MDIIKEIMTDYGVISPLPMVTVEGMAYVPFQPNDAKTYIALKGFEAGTMYPSLDKPFYGSKCKGAEK